MPYNQSVMFKMKICQNVQICLARLDASHKMDKFLIMTTLWFSLVLTIFSLRETANKDSKMYTT